MPTAKHLVDYFIHFLMLFLFWFLLSGHTTPMLLSFGVASCLLAVWVAIRMNTSDEEGHPGYLVRTTLFYWPWLVWEIIKANIDVIKIILKRDMPISPTVVTVEAPQDSALGQVIYANSITLTPGTVTVDMDHGKLTVHALTIEGAKALEDGEMSRRVSKVMNSAPSTGDRS